MNKLAIFVNSFDGYSDLWPSFFKIYDYYWKSENLNCYLSSNFKEIDYPNLIVLKTGYEKDWFYRTIKSLESVNEKYIIFLLEDYFFSKKINEEELTNIANYMEKKNIYFYLLSNNKRFKQECKHIKVPYNTEYPINLQPAIWEKNCLINLLKKIYASGGKTPWDFEKYYVNYYSNNYQGPFFIDGIEYDTRDLLGYKNGVLQGKWIKKTVDFYKKKGIELDTNGRKTLNFKEEKIFLVKEYLSVNTPISIKKTLKKIMKFFGIKFMS